MGLFETLAQIVLRKYKSNWLVMRYNKLVLPFFVLSLAFLSCQDETTDKSSESSTTYSSANKWIYNLMLENYLWYSDIPAESELDFSADSQTFFSSLLSDEDGKDNSSGGHTYYSTFKAYSSTRTISDASDSYGFDFATYNLSYRGSTIKTAVVLYVLKDSPAEEAGLKRGDWILGTDSVIGNISDYSVLRSGSEVSLVVSKWGTLSKTSVINMQESREVEDTPFIKDSIYNYNGATIGYLMYNHFKLGTDEYDTSDTRYEDYMYELFEKFKNAGVNEFILDLRYNTGGDVECARQLASLLAPSSALGNTFCYLEYNDKNTDNNSSVSFLNTSAVQSANLDLDRLYVLTGSYTASASELVINTLRPYMDSTNVRLIGAYTHGKTVGMTVYNASSVYGFVIAPVTFRTYNCNYEANYADGFTPDIYINEYNYEMAEFGSLQDPLFAQALIEIIGLTSRSGSSSSTDSNYLNNVDVDNIKYEPKESILNNLIQYAQE